MSRPADDDMQRDASLERAWRAESTEEPSGALDAAIRAAARRAVSAGPRPAHSPFSARWRVPLSLAAVVVVSATVTLLIAERRQHVPRESAPLSSPAAQPPQPPSPAEHVSPAMRDAPAAAPRGDEQFELARPQPPVAASASPDRDATKKDAAAVSPAERREADVSRQPQGARAAAEADLPTRPPSAPPASLEETPAAAPAPPPEQAPEAAVQRRNHADGMGQAAGARALQRAQPDEGSGSDDSSERLRDSAESKTTRLQVPASPSLPPSGAQLRADETAQREALRAEVATDPQAWIRQIRALDRAGKRAQAQRSLEEFRQHYPDHPLPADLRLLLPPARD